MILSLGAGRTMRTTRWFVDDLLIYSYLKSGNIKIRWLNVWSEFIGGLSGWLIDSFWFMYGHCVLKHVIGQTGCSYNTFTVHGWSTVTGAWRYWSIIMSDFRKCIFKCVVLFIQKDFDRCGNCMKRPPILSPKSSVGFCYVNLLITRVKML